MNFVDNCLRGMTVKQGNKTSGHRKPRHVLTLTVEEPVHPTPADPGMGGVWPCSAGGPSCHHQSRPHPSVLLQGLGEECPHSLTSCRQERRPRVTPLPSLSLVLCGLWYLARAEARGSGKQDADKRLRDRRGKRVQSGCFVSVFWCCDWSSFA